MPYHIRRRLKRLFIVIFMFGAFLLIPKKVKSDSIIAPCVAYAQEQTRTYTITPSYCFAKCDIKYGFNISHKIKQVDYIVVHSTDNPNADAQSHIRWLNRDKSANAVHYYIDAFNVKQALDETIQAWGVGDAKMPNTIRNFNSIQIEICEYSDPIKQKQAIDNAIGFIKNDLLKRYPNARIVSHKQASDKNCPRILLKNKYDWLNFVGQIQGVKI